jgi:[protein-PII] uridylyltransferase
VTTPSSSTWGFPDALETRLQAPTDAVATFRAALTEGTAALRERFEAEEPIGLLVRDRARLVDTMLTAAWHLRAGPMAHELALVAVGGYGRGELHPCSDIDVLILLPKGESTAWQAGLESFLAFLWDIGLEVGHSVRTIDDCQRESLADVSVATALIEARRLLGLESLFNAMRRALASERIWSSADFYAAKVREQQQRHHRHFDTAYILEPNVKSSPGGLRDIQTIAWVAKRHFGAETLDELVGHGFLTEAELQRLKTAQDFLWRVRFALHVITGRREDRLLFDHQQRLAKLFGYEDATYTLAVEQFMQRYYRTVMVISVLNEMLLQLFREVLLTDQRLPPEPLNPRFQVRGDAIETTAEDTFARYPSAMLELFVLMTQNPQIQGIRASTLRSLQRHLWLIDEEFRQNPRHHRLFIEILSAPEGVTRALRRMNGYGVLGRYIPGFGRIVGRMQYDLFHAYTVDAHTLFVVRNMRRMALTRYDHEFPRHSLIYQQLPKPELAILSALFHDIAKGRGGDHSELGGVDAEAFCLEQGLGRYDARLVAWLVRHHLLLSVTAQKKDIADPDVVNDFARTMGDQVHLDYLYILTCADVRGTNPKLWNAWKASLFEDFYERTKSALRRGLETPVDPEELANETQAEARELLNREHVSPDAVQRVWAQFSEAHFLRHSAAEVAWHTTLLTHRAVDDESPLVAVRPQGSRGGTAIFTWTQHRHRSFARTTAVLDQLGLNILDARITPTRHGYDAAVYIVLEDNGAPITDRTRIHEIEKALSRALTDRGAGSLTVTRRVPRQLRVFATQPQVDFSDDERNGRTILELVAADRPGLLSEVGRAFVEARVEVHGARIVTVGERAEDVFYLSDADNRPLDAAARDRLRDCLVVTLAPPASAQ